MKLSEVFELVLREYEGKGILDLTYEGICITLLLRFGFKAEERNKALDYMRSHKPATNYSKTSMFWWSPGSKAPRKRWLKKHIALLKSQGL